MGQYFPIQMQIHNEIQIHVEIQMYLNTNVFEYKYKQLIQRQIQSERDNVKTVSVV